MRPHEPAARPPRPVLALALVLTAALAGRPATGSDTPGGAWAGAADDGVLDVALLTGTRAVFLRLRVTAAGVPYRSAWGEVFGRLHAYLDADGDGVLTAAEADRARWPQLFLNPFNMGPRTPPPRAAAPADADPRDGAVSSRELAEHLRAAYGVGALGVYTGPPPREGSQAVFAQLDRDGDHALSPDELAGAEACVARLDRDEDERVSLGELAPDRSLFADVFADVNPVEGEDDDPGPVAALATDGDRDRAARRLLSRFGHGGGPSGRRIAADKLPADPAAFRAADSDGDGGLDLGELRAFLSNPPPDFEAVVALGVPGPGSARLTRVPAAAGRSDPSLAARTVGDHTLVIGFEGAEVDLSAVDMIRSIGHSIPAVFQKADRDHSHTVDRGEAQGNNLFQHLFLVADRDGDGALSEPEVASYVERTRDATFGRTGLMVYDRGLVLHHRLDADGDGALSVRELREGRRRLAPLDRDGDGRLTLAEVPRRYEVAIGRGFGIVHGFAVAPRLPAVAARGAGRAGAPTWFLRMDRNRDGDVSPREFHGPPETFRRIDADGDRLIDADEAAEAERQRPPARAGARSAPS